MTYDLVPFPYDNDSDDEDLYKNKHPTRIW